MAIHIMALCCTQEEVHARLRVSRDTAVWFTQKGTARRIAVDLFRHQKELHKALFRAAASAALWSCKQSVNAYYTRSI